jgi:hypothetical protein
MHVCPKLRCLVLLAKTLHPAEKPSSLVFACSAN